MDRAASAANLPVDIVPLWAISFLSAVVKTALPWKMLPWQPERRFIASLRADGNADLLVLSSSRDRSVRTFDVASALNSTLQSRRAVAKLVRNIRREQEQGDWAAETLVDAGRYEAADEEGLNISVAELGLEAVNRCRPHVVLGPMPKMVPLCVPTPPFDIEAGTRRSSSGVMAKDQRGQIGVTACFHGAGPVGSLVQVGARECIVSAADQVQDTVFVPLPDGVNYPELHGRRGLLTKRPPWQTERVRFHGSTSGERWCRITGIDIGLPGTRPNRQLCVQTTPDTDEGDSGAALLNEDDEVVGFAFQRTAWGEPIQFTDWIWAASALQALNLQMVTM